MAERPKTPDVKKAVALDYDRDKDTAPRVTAKGRGLVAEKIEEIAAAHNIPIQRDRDLVEVLEKVELDQEIPLEVYRVVAEIFAYIYETNKQKAPR
jgi:flagellar biosynthesis protein